MKSFDARLCGRACEAICGLRFAFRPPVAAAHHVHEEVGDVDSFQHRFEVTVTVEVGLVDLRAHRGKTGILGAVAHEHAQFHVIVARKVFGELGAHEACGACNQGTHHPPVPCRVSAETSPRPPPASISAVSTPISDGGRSSRASDRRKPKVTRRWIRTWVWE